MCNSAPDTQSPEGTDNENSSSLLSNKQLYLFTFATAIATANAYYIHPIISRVAESFNVSATMIGAVPAFNQIALAIGIILLLPLGDWVNNRRLTAVLLAAQCLALLLMAVAENYGLFVVGSTVLGFFTVVPYLLPSYISKRVDPKKLGQVIGMLTSGVIGGVLVARVGAGILGEYYDWRLVYLVAAFLMLIVSILLHVIMKDDSAGSKTTVSSGYLSLVFSIFTLVKDRQQVLMSGIMQGLAFGIFLSVWLVLGLHLTSPEMGYGVDIVGYMAGLSFFNLIFVPRLGAWADKVGPQYARWICSVVTFGFVLLLAVTGNNIWLLMIPVLGIGYFMVGVDISGRMLLLVEKQDIRTRLMTVYISLMFLGAGISSWAATASYDWKGWTGSMLFIILSSTLLLLFAFLSFRARNPSKE